MADIQVHAGDFYPGKHSFMLNVFVLRSEAHKFGESIPMTELEAVEIASEESVKKLGGAVGWGLAGAALLGPVGLVAGLLGGGRKTEVTFVARFRDGRKMLATADSKTYKKLMAATF